MQNLYLKDDTEALHPLLAEALWDMLALLVTELKMTSLNLFSRYADKPEPFSMPEVLCHYWAPLLLVAFKKRELMSGLTDVHISCIASLLERLVDILNECALHPYDAAGLLALYKAARAAKISTVAILSEQALEHAEGVSEADKAAIAAGIFVPPPEVKLIGSVDSTAAAPDDKDTGQLNERIELFASVISSLALLVQKYKY